MPPFQPRTPSDDLEAKLEADQRQRHWVLSPKQRAFLECKDQYTFYVGGIGAGKTFAGALKAIVTALSPEYAGSLGVVAAPTYPMLEDATLRKFLEMIPPAAIKSYNKNSHTLHTINNSTILFRSLDKPETLRGTTIAWFWIDEAPIGGYHAWEILKGRLRQTPYRVMAWATGTPRGKDKFWEAFAKESPKRLDGHTLFQASTMENAKNLPENYVQNLGYTGKFFEQEVLGQFTSFEGLVYPAFDPTQGGAGHVRTPRRDAEYKLRFGGIDWGWNHPCAILPMAADVMDRVYLLDEWVEPGKELNRHIIPQVIHFTRKYGITTWWCDSAGAQLIREVNRALDNAQLDCSARACTKGPDSVATGIQTVQRFLELRPDGTRGLYLAPWCPKTRDEFGLYQYKTSMDDKASRSLTGKDEPMKVHDDAMDALRYALHETFGRGRSSAIPMAVSSANAPSSEGELLRLLDTETDPRVRTILVEALARMGFSEEEVIREATTEQQTLARVRERNAKMLAIAEGQNPFWWETRS